LLLIYLPIVLSLLRLKFQSFRANLADALKKALLSRMTYIKRALLTLLTLLCLVVLGAGLIALIGYRLSSATSTETDAKLESSQNVRQGKVQNLEPAAGFEFSWASLAEAFAEHPNTEPVDVLPLRPISAARLSAAPRAGLRYAWLGHSSVLLEVDGLRLLTDPVFSERASPFSFAGPKRFHPTPLALADTQNIDAVVISHNHYDHMDEASIRHLAAQGAQIFVPLGNKPQVLDWGVASAQVHEMDWGQSLRLGQVEITATPARHYSSRGMFDLHETMWASWVISGPDHRVYFSGDTGYGKSFQDIGKAYGPFDLTVMKIGAYGPGQSWVDVHMPPEETIQAHMDLRGKIMLPTHWGTFNLGYHPWKEPIERAQSAAKAKGVTLASPILGAIHSTKKPTPQTNWWAGLE